MKPLYYWPNTQIVQSRLTRLVLRPLMSLDVLWNPSPRNRYYYTDSALKAPRTEHAVQRKLYP